MKRSLTMLLVLLALAPATSFGGRDRLAARYLDPSVMPRPLTCDGGKEPSTEGFTYGWQRCWGTREGVVCSACYKHPERWLGQATVLCPWDRECCRWVLTADEAARLRVNWSQCEVSP